MDKPGSSLEDGTPMEVEFADKEISRDSFVDGSFFYCRSFGIVTFLLTEDDVFTLCIGHGNFKTGNVVKTYDRVKTFKDRETAEKALQDITAATFEYFKKLWDEIGQ